MILYILLFLQFNKYNASSTNIFKRTVTANPLWLLGDHLGSTSKVANYYGLSVQSEQLYMPWGETRYPSGASALPTTYRYTGQRQEDYIKLYWIGSKWYDAQLGRWIQPDQIVPESQGVQAYDRYAYVNNSPVNYTDPTGHMCSDPEDPTPTCDGAGINQQQYRGNIYSKEEPPFDANLGGSNEIIEDGNNDDIVAILQSALISNTTTDPNPSLPALVAGGALLFIANAVIGLALDLAEVPAAALAATNPALGVPVELGLIAVGLAVVDIDMAYMSYTYRVFRNPDVKQDFIFTPWWGLNK